MRKSGSSWKVVLCLVSMVLITIIITSTALGDCQGLCGDANEDASVGTSDAVFIINYVFIPGSPQPQPILACGDADGNGRVNISDAVWIIKYVFVGGSPSPGNCSPGSWEGLGGDCCPFVG